MKSILTIFTLIVTCLAPLPAAEQESHDQLDVRLVAEVTAVNPGQPFYMGVLFDLEDHWHIYWKNPGDAGLQPEFDWHLPDGFSINEIEWPYPEKIMVSGLANYGYEHEVLLMAKILPPSDLQPGKQINVGVSVKWLVCREVCIPGEAHLNTTLPVSTGPVFPDDRWVQKFSDFRTRHPLVTSDWNITGSIADSLIILQIQNPDWYRSDFKELIFFPDQEEIIANAGRQAFSQKYNGYTLKIPLSDMRMTNPDSISGVLVAQEGWRGIDSEKALWINLDLAVRDTQDDSSLTGIGLALLFAFIGGIILNIMPCVLPVLSLKILGFVQQAGEDRRKVFSHGLIFTAGVVSSFVILALLLIILRGGGQELGWGFQLQSPEFIMILSAFLFLFGLNLFGVFEIGTSVMGAGQRLAGKGGWFGSFMSGVTATIVATPCTAPFMGSALGFALTQSNTISLLIFAFLGLGMAFPYLLLSAAPGLLKFVPKPGQWMESLKQFMGFLLLATVIWLIWVFGIQTDIDSVAILLVVLLGSGLGAWIIGRWTQLTLPAVRRHLLRILAIGIILSSISLGLGNISASQATGMPSQSADGIQWEQYSMEKLKSGLDQGRPVFIDFTAAWCLSCQVNERLAFGSEEVQQKLADLNFLMLKADWTNRDKNITRALAGYGRNSVPLYVIHTGPDMNKKVILPEIISPAIVLEYLEEIEK